MKKRIWTEEEVDFLKNNYLELSRKEMSKQLNIPLTLIARKMKELSLYSREKEPEIGDKINRLTIKEKFLKNIGSQNKTYVKCECECGKVVETLMTNVLQGHTKSCGCFHSEQASIACSKRNFVHGLSNTRLFRIWAGMIERCTNPTEDNHNYQGRGISVCEEWINNFQNFYDWAISNGYEEELTLDRKDNDGNYEPTNCRWATRQEQSLNKRTNVLITAFGETKTVKEWSEDIRFKAKNADNLSYRIRVGWDGEKAIATPC